MKCPSDGTELSSIQVSSITIDKCHECDGIWLDHGELQRLRSSGDQGIEQDLEEQYGNPETKQGATDAYMRCPVCGDVGLMRHHISYFKPVKVDQCPSCHGIWLDDRELDTLLEDQKEMDDKLHSPGVMAFVRRLARRFR